MPRNPMFPGINAWIMASYSDAIGRKLGVRKPESNFRFRCYRTPKSDILTF